MADYQITILAPAREDLLHIADYYFHQVGALSAEKITTKILDQIEKLSTHPYLGSLHSDPKLADMGYRKLLSGDYVCIYRILEQTVFVYRIVHGQTDYPQYFHKLYQ